MRLLLSFILSFFFFIIPSESNAAEVSVHKLTKSFPQEGNVNYSTNDECAAIIPQAVSGNNYSIRYKSFLFINFVNTIDGVHQNLILLKKENFIQSYLYCKPIGLKLIFPKHYFW